MIIDGFKEKNERSEITYVVAKYRVIDAHWYPYGELLEPGGIDHSESSRNNQSELIRNSQCTCLAN